jgi:type I restriction enzyme R subunit
MAVNAETDEQRKKYEAQVHDLIGSDISLHDKQDLIQKFIEENMPKMINGQSVQVAFAQFWDAEKEQAYQHLCKEENLKPEAMKTVLDNYEFTKRLPRKEELKDLPNYKVKLFERESVFNQLWDRTRKFIQTFILAFE